MPPKARITREDITATALALVREKGEGAINARAIANSLQCSTQPVFSNFANMESLRESVIKSAYNEYFGFIENEIKSGKYPRYKSFGMAYIRFAREEKELFRLLFMRDRSGEDTSALSPDFEESVRMLMQANDISEESARLMHLEMWTAVHGIATMTATSFL
ncbi:MAG: TetR/AcrR family transcriptional regulator, partial [Clostridia bacterium]|nr:TetR/AcrR family transcriptional regulator [Clostridia bacterium]